MKHSPSGAADRSSASQEILRIFLEPEGSLPHSQNPATSPYAESDQSRPCLVIPIVEDPF